jgi:hypothetical protein
MREVWRVSRGCPALQESFLSSPAAGCPLGAGEDGK